MRIIKMFAMILAIFFVVGCGGGGSGNGGAPNSAPVAISQSVTTSENTSVSIVLASSGNTDGDPLTYTHASASHGSISGSGKTLTYMPDTGYVGSDSFTFTVSDTKDSSSATVSITVASLVQISGKVTYDSVPPKSDYNGLDYDNIVQKPARNVIVQAVLSGNNIVRQTSTDSNGNYTLTGLPQNTDVAIRVLAEMKKTGTPSWEMKVVNNTNHDALYTMQGSWHTTGTADSTRDLNAPSGWNGTEYGSNRLSGIFAILDTVYAATQKVLSADPHAIFPPLAIHWSPDNKAVSGNVAIGRIGTSYYSNGNLYILGDATDDGDTDEFDDHVIAHEWGHYYEDKFSRMDSIGGSHGGGDLLDIRVAFSEGWGNAFSAMVLDDEFYYDTDVDTFGATEGWMMDIENETHMNPGWFSEASIQRILYDIYDSHNDSDQANDTLSMGFGSIHAAMTGKEKRSKAFVSIFTFIHALKTDNAAGAGKIDDIVSSESIATINDDFGAGRTHHGVDYPYHDANTGSVTQVTVKGRGNKLGSHQYLRFSIATSGSYAIQAKQTNGTDSDPVFILFQSTPSLHELAIVNQETSPIEAKTINLASGEYIMDLYDYNGKASSDFNVTINNQ